MDKKRGPQSARGERPVPTEHVGETLRFKQVIRSNVDEATFREVVRTASRIIQRLPAGVKLGTTTAALMLAATAYAESAAAAKQLIESKDGAYAAD